jgi:nucleoside-diphosphate-sugar epimerase
MSFEAAGAPAGRVLVTGGTGSLGSALVRRLLDDGADVTVLIPPGEGQGGLAGRDGHYRRAVGDIRDPVALAAAMAGIQTVFHLAGVATLLNRLHARMVEVNVEGARNVARAAAAASVARLVHTSSVSAVGYPPDGEIADETFDIARSAATNSYLLTKRAGEEAVLAEGRRGGLDVVVVNPAAVIAPYSHPRHGWAALVRRARARRLVAAPPGGLAVCATSELVAGQLAACARGRAGRRYILTTANLTYRELFALVCREVGCRPPRLTVPAPAVRLAGRAGQLAALAHRDPMRSPVLVPENAALGVRSLYYSPSRARGELGIAVGDITASVREVDRWLAREEHR